MLIIYQKQSNLLMLLKVLRVITTFKNSCHRWDTTGAILQIKLPLFRSSINSFFIVDMHGRKKTNVNHNVADKFVLPDVGVELPTFGSLTQTLRIE